MLMRAPAPECDREVDELERCFRAHIGRLRLRARRGDRDAGTAIAASWQEARGTTTAVIVRVIGPATAEWAWLADQPELAREVCRAVFDGDERRAVSAWIRGEILRYAARAGVDVRRWMDAQCPSPWASGLQGDWRVAAQQWERLGDRYEQALELTASGQDEATARGLQLLADLGAAPAAARLRHEVPGGASQPVPHQPGGLTGRQAEVLELLVDGLTNAEIATELVVSVRTVDHHVAAVLAKLGVRSRRHAARLAVAGCAGRGAR
jgi:DNA-binding CsgD family transcriptional regulator